ncbi:aldehyde dehydrogenase family protein [Verticiella sediminum]|uniref:Aldehyde dehydrogenase family protein n=1 Tax=Verticiella sediminum TaxID=1247510 RepID=A0A556AW18_9BURK|nr:aldehyde dehydrogenase family protein [Verticiella sediminum]TSH97110.1 aldehyde dehydrogenase family protein [Verticiella sediminum]
MQVGLRIGAQERPAENGDTFVHVCPRTGRPVTEAASASTGDALAAADAAQAASAAWRATPVGARRDILARAAELLAAESQDFIDLMVAETGTSTAWARFNVDGGVAGLKEAAALASQVAGEVMPSNRAGCLALTERTPVGVVLSIAPWNAPVHLAVRAIAVPLVCGNTLVFKSSELCPGTHARLAGLFVRAGLPAGVLNVISHAPAAGPRIVEALIAHTAVRRVNFTGSTRTGRAIGELAGRHLKPALLELGGKAPLIVLADADIEAAGDAAAFGAFMNQGQICMSTERIVVDHAIADEFAACFAALADGLNVRIANGSVDAGALARPASAAHVQALVSEATACGARLLTAAGDECIVLDHVDASMRVYREESFGPVAPIIRVDGEAAAVAVANDSEYGLAAAVFGRDLSRTLRVARSIDCGVCHVNGATVSSEPHFPFGGVKASGYGRFGGRAAIEAFTELRLLTIHTERQRYGLA